MLRPLGLVVIALLLACAHPMAEDERARVTTARTTATTTTAVIDPTLSLVAQAIVPRVDVLASPDAAEPTWTLSHPTDNGGPLVFLVKGRQPGWLELHLPVRPNGSVGWVRAGDVSVSQHNYRIVVELAAHQITVFQGDDVVLHEPVGLGTNATPTPGGVFYLKELLVPPDPNGVYGPYAYGLSGFSNELTSFAGGEGVIGIHGTDDPMSLGTDVSHGCIRMTNEGITTLAAILPLGTPVDIRP